MPYRAGRGLLLPVLLAVCGAAAVSIVYGLCSKKIKQKYHKLPLAMVLFLIAWAIGWIRTAEDRTVRLASMPYLIEGETISVCGVLEKKEEKYDQLQLYLSDVSILVDESILAERTIHTEETLLPCNSCILYTDTDLFRIGDTLLAKGKVKLFEAATNEGMFDQQSYFAAQKIDFAMSSPRISCVEKTKLPLAEYLYRLRKKLTASLENAAEEWEQKEALKGNAGIIISMLYGEKSAMDSAMQDLYRTAGIAHILAISGLHVSMVGMGLYRFLRKGSMSFAASALAAGSVLLLYVRMTGMGISTLRAAGMLLLGLLARVMGRSTDMQNSLGVMMLVLLYDNPFLIGYSGFWFSCVSIFAISLSEDLTAESGGRKKDMTAAGKIRSRCMQGLFLYLIMLPVTAYVYNEVPLYSFFLNLVVLPTVSVIFFSGFAASLAGFLAGTVFQAASSCLLLPAEGVLWLYHKLCKTVLLLPKAVLITGHPSWGKILLYYGLLGLWLYVFYGRRRKPKEANWPPARRQPAEDSGMLMICALLFAVLLWRPVQTLEIDMLDVGQGDGIYLQTEEGVRCFIDGGSSNEKSVGKYRLLPFLKYKGIGRVDLWFVTHADEDHISGLRELLQTNYPITNLVVSVGAASETGSMAELLQLAKEHNVRILFLEQGDCIRKGKSSFTCIYPAGQETGQETNDRSLTILFETEGFTAFFGGDISENAEQELIRAAREDADLAERLEGVTLYKVSHHGSRYSSSERFLDLIRPAIALISAGENNAYGHPHEETIARLEETGTRILRTGRGGQITVRYRKGRVFADYRDKFRRNIYK